MKRQKITLSVPVEVVGMNPKKDRTWSLKFETRELRGDEVKMLADNFLGAGWLVFSPNDDISQDDIPKTAAEPGTKSPSERLRDVLFVLYKQRGVKDPFEMFYQAQMERFIEVVKSKLEKEE